MNEVPAASIAVLFVNFHSETLILPKVQPLRSAGMRVYVVDNSGTMPEGEVETIRPGRNLGFGAAINYAEEHLPTGIEVLCFHNPDADIDPVQILRLAAILDGRRCGARAPLEQTGSTIRAGFRYPSAVRELAVAFLGTRQKRGPSAPPPARSPAIRLRGRRFASGALLVVHRSAHRDIGGFDERYFLYVEDLDYWHRLHLQGWNASIDFDLTATHRASSGSSLASGRRELLRWLGVELFMESHNVRGQNIVRAAHRALLSRLEGWPGVTETTLEAWRAGCSSAEVMRRVRVVIDGSHVER